MQNFFKHLFQRGDYYALVWVYMIAKMSNAKIYTADISVLCARFDITNSQVREVLAHGSKYAGATRFAHHVDLKGVVKVQLIFAKTEKELSESEIEINEKIDEVMEYFNNVMTCHGKRGFKKNGKEPIKYIKRRLKDGYSVDDMKDVIDAKSDWLTDEKFHKFYRPQTIFNEKFESYLNEADKPVAKSKTDQKNEQFTDAAVRAATDNY